MRIADFIEVAAPESVVLLYDGENMIGRYNDARDIELEYWGAEVYRIKPTKWLMLGCGCVSAIAITVYLEV